MGIRYFSDHLNNIIPVSFPPKRIISLVPSQTELLSDLGLDPYVAGITKFCVYPQGWLSKKKIIGGTKKFNFDAIHSLHPDLILANREENYQEGINRLKEQYPVWVSDVVTWQDSIRMMQDIGEITDREREAERLTQTIEFSFLSVPRLLSGLCVVYLIWRDPWMGAASGTFIHTMIEKIGLRNCLEAYTRYPKLSEEQIWSMSPDLIFLSSEPFPFKESHRQELKIISPRSHVVLVDGEMFSWHGSRQLLAATYLTKLAVELSDHCKAK